ncbi:nucleotidyl transferase AbiEii/AbiGii toxin family protein [Compostibacter hankyongensis]|uniref:Nucleotidyl transferase AbiEii/AbiGii toxin family protein n=1 Tax=Compostibacter hankyongensis TaxID=1007089 RepID=A0ABP8G254_9BACT
MNLFPDKDLIEEVALQKGIQSAFVEKDWYVTQVLRKIIEYHFEDFQIVFTGGTALSKAHKLIQRFSEDIDFRVIVPPNLATESKSRQSRILSVFKNEVVAYLKTEFPIDKDKIFARNGNQFFSIEFYYPTLFTRSDVLRPHLLIEFTVANSLLPVVSLPVSSFINELSGNTPEIEIVGCTDPVESAIDKLSAITWRIAERERGQQNDDPDIVRHIHDLSILSELAIRHAEFRRLAIEVMTKDEARAKKTKGRSVKEKFEIVLNILHEDKEYPEEYDRFVKGMSYAPNASIASFPEAVEALQKLIHYILQ